MIKNPTAPSYKAVIDDGLTTLPENLREPYGSLNHHFWGDVSAWFIKVVAGIRFNPEGNDVHCVQIKPAFLKTLDHASGYYEAPAGKIDTAWARDGESINLTLEIPAEIHGDVILPEGYVFADGGKTKPAASGEFRIVRG
jgi:alpha-L-rhamnosidase